MLVFPDPQDPIARLGGCRIRSSVASKTQGTSNVPAQAAAEEEEEELLLGCI